MSESLRFELFLLPLATTCTHAWQYNNNNFISTNIYMIMITVSYLSQLIAELGKAGTNLKLQIYNLN